MVHLETLFLVYLLFACLNCENAQSLRHMFHPEETELEANAGLNLVTDPRHDVSIFIDGERVAQKTPFTKKTLFPGTHVLEIRSQGYFPFSMPIALESGKTLAFNVTLRSREKIQSTLSQEKPTVHEPLQFGTATTQSIQLLVRASPPAPILVDGLVMIGQELLLQQEQGYVAVGRAQLAYETSPNNSILLRIPEVDPARWYEGNHLINPQDAIKLTGQTLKLQRITTDGSSQSFEMTRR